MSFERFFTQLTMPASDADYSGVFGTTAQTLSLSSNLSSLSAEASEIVKWIRYKLGEPKITVELDNLQIFSAFEEANIEYGAIVNKSQARNWLSNYMGSNRDFSTQDYSNTLPFNTLDYLKRLAEPYATEANIGGRKNKRKAYVTAQSNKIDYSILDDAVDHETGMTLSAYLSSVGSGWADVRDVYHQENVTTQRFYDPYSSTNLLQQEFQYESFGGDTQFYLQPIWADILRAGMLETSDRVRRSNFSYHMFGENLKLLPAPTRSIKIWFTYTVASDPNIADSSANGISDPSITGVSSLSNIPFSDLKYEDINSFGKAWIRQYCFGLCLETLGRIRRKFAAIPIPNGEMNLDGDQCVSEGIELKDKLREELREELGSLQNDNMMKNDAELAEAIEQQYQRIAMPTPFIISG